MNLSDPIPGRLTPWQRELSGIALVLRERLCVTTPELGSPCVLWWGTGYSDLQLLGGSDLSAEVVLADCDSRQLRRGKGLSGEHSRLVKLLHLSDLRRDTAGVDAALKNAVLRDVDSYLAFEEKLLHRFDANPAVHDDWAGVVVMDFVLNRTAAKDEAIMLAEAMRVMGRGGVLLSATLVADEPTDAQSVKFSPAGPAVRLPTEREVFRAFEAAGFHGIRLHWAAIENPAPVDRIGGVDIRMCLIEAYKGKQGPCLELGQAVMYGGPWKEVHDDDGHTYRRGERVAVCAKTYNLLMRSPYQGELMGLRSSSEPLLEHAQPFDCNTPALREPGVTKGLTPFSGARVAQSSCNPDSGCC